MSGTSQLDAIATTGYGPSMSRTAPRNGYRAVRLRLRLRLALASAKRTSKELDGGEKKKNPSKCRTWNFSKLISVSLIALATLGRFESNSRSEPTNRTTGYCAKRDDAFKILPIGHYCLAFNAAPLTALLIDLLIDVVPRRWQKIIIRPWTGKGSGEQREQQLANWRPEAWQMTAPR